MEENRKGFIMPIAEAVPAKGPGDTVRIQDEKGQIKVVKNTNKALEKSELYKFLRPSSSSDKIGAEPSIHLWINSYKMQPGGAVDEHYREYNNTDMPIFDEVLYVISGRIRAKVGDIEKTVGKDTLIYFPSNAIVSFTNVGRGPAKFLKIGASDKGKIQGMPIYFKKPKYTV
jgi:mannose-6-phosphate isomerase-like protein (cupin superfamily)